MRFALILLAAGLPTVAFAQTQPPAARPGQDGISRDEFVRRAASAAGRRFDLIDTTHSGTITHAQLRAWREAHGSQANQTGGVAQ